MLDWFFWFLVGSCAFAIVCLFALGSLLREVRNTDRVGEVLISMLIVALCFGFRVSGADASTMKMANEAISAGYAKWEINPEGEKEFVWIAPVSQEEGK